MKDALSFQVYRDLSMMDDKPNILLFYEELVKQFGYIVLFSGIFPLAALLSFISNGIQVRSQIKNLSYVRRFRAEPSFGIGNWFSCLESLSFASIIINCYATYATSNVYAQILVIKKEKTDGANKSKAIDLENNTFKQFLGWNELKFFIFIVIMEHAILLLKYVLHRIYDDVPESVQKGKRDN